MQHRGGHARAHPAGRALPAAGAGRGGRAAPLRRAAARGAAPQGRRRGRAGDDGHAHPAHAGPHRLRRPRRVGARRAPARPHAHPAPSIAPPPSAARWWKRCGARWRRAARPTSCTRWSRSRRSWRTCARPPRWRRSGARPCPQARIGLLHGRLEGRGEGAGDGRLLRAASCDVLVATTVVEVGVDVPNATVMVIEHAERFGLAQLHQLRGRVGRGAAASHLPAGDPRPALRRGARAHRRAWSRSDDGFVIAEKDLELRGPGDFFGTRQSGLPRLPRGRPHARPRPARARAARGLPLRGRAGARTACAPARDCSSRAAGSAASAWPGWECCSTSGTRTA